MSEIFFFVVVGCFIVLTIALAIKWYLEGLVFYRMNEQDREIQLIEWKLDVEERQARKEDPAD